MRRASDIITDLLMDPEMTDDAKEALREGIDRPHRNCPCAGCMRAYLRSTSNADVEPVELREQSENESGEVTRPPVLHG